MNISIVSGWFPVVIEGLAVVALLLAVDWKPTGRRRLLRWGVPIATGVTLVVALVHTLGSLPPSDVPWWAYLWGFTFALMVWSVAAGWSGAGWGRRVVLVVALVLTLAATLGTVNARSGTFPTLSRLLTDQPENVVGIPQLRQMRDQVITTGKLPSQGVVITVTIPPTASHFSTRPAYVYLPPAWFAGSIPSLPTLVLLPGEPGSAEDRSAGGDADNTADAFAQTHHGVAPIIVMPDPNGFATEDSECVNSKFGNAETYLVQDVPAFVRKQFGASTAPGSLAVGGLSAGGTCAVMLAVTNPTVYRTFASFSGFSSPEYQEATRRETIDTLFGGSRKEFDAHDPAQLLRHGRFDGMAGWFEVGDEDQDPLDAAHLLQPLAFRAGIETCILVRPGGHDYDLWSRALQDAFPWLSWKLGLTPKPKSEQATCEPP
jgi:S-formylglutathione hydrolase FrmB